MINKIENKLSELMNLLGEKEYVQFIESDKLLKIYDLVMGLEENENILTEETLVKIYNLIESKIESSK